VLAACGAPEAGQKVSGAPQPTAAEPSLDQAADDLRDVDWQQATLTARFCGVDEPVTMRNGEVKAASATWGQVRVWVTVRKPVWYGDLDGDGRDEAAVSLGCGTAPRELAFGLVVVRSRDGALELVGEIATTTMRDDAPHVPMLTDPQFGRGGITVKELWYRPGDSNCCPSGASLTRWSLRDGTLKAETTVQVS
jgi:hypothetical protein